MPGSNYSCSQIHDEGVDVYLAWGQRLPWVGGPIPPYASGVVLGFPIVPYCDCMRVLGSCSDSVKLCNCVESYMLIPGVIPEKSCAAIADLPEEMLLNELFVGLG